MEISVEKKPHSGQPKKFEDKELEVLLEQGQSQTQGELAESLGVTQQAVSVDWKPFKNENDSKTRKLVMNWNRETLKGDFSLANSWFKDNRETSDCDWRWEVDILQ